MSAAPRQPDPAPHADRLSTRRAFFMLFGGPLAWLLQICIAVPLLSWPCFPHSDRLRWPLAGYAWTRSGAIALSLICLAVALAAGFVARAKLVEVAQEKDGDHGELIEIGHGRTRFTAIWGVILSFGFALATALTLLPFLMVARCEG